MQAASDSRQSFVTMALVLAAVLLCTAVIYWPGLNGPFVLDDQQNIIAVYVENPGWDGFVFSITHNTSGMLGRVVSIASFMLSGLEYGVEPWGYKFHNLLLHLLTGLLVWRLSLLTLPVLVPDSDRRQHLLTAVFVAAFWLLHPLLVSTVLYVVQRMTMLAALFTLAGLLCYLALRRMQASARYYQLAFILYPLLQVLAVFSKEIGALLPVYILLYEALVFRSLRNLRGVQRHHQWFLLVFVGMPLTLGGLYLLTHIPDLADYSARNFTLAERLLTQLHVVPTYLRMMLLPRVRDMSLYHDDVVATTGFDAVTLALLALLAALAASIWLLRRRAPVIAFGLGWFFISHLLESTIIPLELMFEHRNYLALVGVLLPVVYYAVAWRERKLGYAVLALFLALLTLQTFSRVGEWSNEDVFYAQAVTDHPRSVRPRTETANLLTRHGNFSEAIEHLEVAAQIDPKDVGPLLHALTLHCARGERREDVIEHIEQVFGQYPATVYAMNAMEYLYAVISRQQCTFVTVTDMGRMLTAAQEQAGNKSNQLTRGYLLRLQSWQSLLSGQYANGVIYMRMAYDETQDIGIMIELVERQIAFGKLQDAEDTLNAIREINVTHHGIETYQVNRLAKLLQEAPVGVPALPAAEPPAAPTRLQ